MTGKKQTKAESTQRKAQIIAVFESGGDWRRRAEELCVPVSTAYRWINLGDLPDRRGGARGRKILEEHLAFISEEIERNPRICLDELRVLLCNKYEIQVSNECIRGHLDGLLYTLKAVRLEPENGNSPENKDKRHAYVRSLLDYQSRNLPILYIDETNFNIHISRKEGRSRRGTRASVVAAGSRGANIHVIGCIGVIGLVHHSVKRGSFKKEDAQIWVKECLRRGMMAYGQKVVLVLDNAPCHSGVEDVLMSPEFEENVILRLGPYSPMLNPIESAWSVLKSDVKKELARKIGDILNNSNRANLTITEYRLQALEEIIHSSIVKITPSLCNSVISGIQKWIPNVLNYEDMEY